MRTLNREKMNCRLKSIFLLAIWFTFVLDVTGIVPISIHEKPERPRLLVSDGVPFVPEEFRDYSNIIFNKIDFREITLATKEKIDGLESILLQMIKNETELNVEIPPDEIFVDTSVKYVGRGLWTNNGRNARLAVTLEGFVCQNRGRFEDAKCHTKRCHLELNETFLPPPWPLGEDIDSRRQNVSILRWSCARKERWCYACRDPNVNLFPSNPNGNEELEFQENWPICHAENPMDSDDELFKLNCNRQYGDISKNKRYGCSVTFTQVAGIPTEIQSRSCKIVDAEEASDDIGICQTDAMEYSSKCTCHKSGCNGNIFVRKKIGTSFRSERESPSSEIRTSIQQLRADMERMMKRYSMTFQQQKQPSLGPRPSTSFVEH